MHRITKGDKDRSNRGNRYPHVYWTITAVAAARRLASATSVQSGLAVSVAKLSALAKRGVLDLNRPRNPRGPSKKGRDMSVLRDHFHRPATGAEREGPK